MEDGSSFDTTEKQSAGPPTRIEHMETAQDLGMIPNRHAIPEAIPLNLNVHGSSQQEPRARRSSHASTFVEDIKPEIMVEYLFGKQNQKLWLNGGIGETEGVMLRGARDDYLARPSELAETAFGKACMALNVACVITVKTRVIQNLLRWTPDATEFPFSNGARVQVLRGISDVANAKIHQNAAFIAEDGLLVVWDEDPTNVIARASRIESEVMKLIWSTDDKEEADA